MGHYDLCRDKTWIGKDMKCSGEKLIGTEKLKEFKGFHNWVEHGYGVQICTNCGKIIYYT